MNPTAHTWTRRRARRSRAREAIESPVDSLSLFDCRPSSRDSTERGRELDSNLRRSSAIGRAGGTRVPQRLELGLRDIAVEHGERQTREAEPAGARIARHELMRDQPIVADAELTLHPTVLVDFGVQRARA